VTIDAWVGTLACPACRGALRAVSGGAAAGALRCSQCSAEYPVRNGIPRFVPADNYASGFGLQWNRFRTTQLDSRTGLQISRDRFFRQSGWDPAALRGRLVLDVGCGAGRFAEIALACGARVVALDYSTAVEACHANLAGQGDLLVVQGDIRRLPFAPGTFDYVYCFGVLQHTPDPAAAFRALPSLLKEGGRIAVDVYPRLALNLLWPKYWLRPLTRRLPPSRLAVIVERMVPVALPVSRALGHVPVLGRWLRYAVPVANYEGVYPLSEEQLREWAVLDTFDMLAPAHDHPQTAATLRSWLEAAGLRGIEVFRSGFLVGRGVQASRR
jgi:SAM-dependent methyltransferase